MAVTLTLDELRAYIETGPTEDGGAHEAFLAGWLASATIIVERYAPSAPDTIHDRAVQMVVGYWWASHDNPAVIRDHHVEFTDTWVDPKRSANALRFSGAMALLSPYRRRRALGGDPATATPRGPGGLPADEVRRLIAESIAGLPPAPELPDVPDVAPWALVGDTSLIPPTKLPGQGSTITPDIEGGFPDFPAVYPWARAGDVSLIPADKLPAPPTLPDIAPWALAGDPTLIPADKLPPPPEPPEVPGRTVLYQDTATYTHGADALIFRVVELTRAPVRGRGLLITLCRTQDGVMYPLEVGATDDWLDLSAMRQAQRTGPLSGVPVTIENTICVKTPQFSEGSTDSFGHGAAYVARAADNRLGFAFAQNRGVRQSWRMTVREVP